MHATKLSCESLWNWLLLLCFCLWTNMFNLVKTFYDLFSHKSMSPNSPVSHMKLACWIQKTQNYTKSSENWNMVFCISDFWCRVFGSPLYKFFIFQECQLPFAALLPCWLPRFSVPKEFTLPWERRETKQRCWVILQISWIVLLEVIIFVSLSFRCGTLNFCAGSKHRTLW